MTVVNKPKIIIRLLIATIGACAAVSIVRKSSESSAEIEAATGIPKLPHAFSGIVAADSEVKLSNGLNVSMPQASSMIVHKEIYAHGATQNFAENEDGEFSVLGKPTSPIAVALRKTRPQTSISGLPTNAVARDLVMDVNLPMSDSSYQYTEQRNGTHKAMLLVCKSFLVEGPPSDIVAIEPLRSFHNVHHMHLHVCNSDSAAWKKHRNVWDVRGDMQRCDPPSWSAHSGCHGQAFTYLPGVEGVLFPDGVGHTIGAGQFELRHLVLEVHFDHPHELQGKHDESGFRLWGVPENVVKHRVGIFAVADPFARSGLLLPPQKKSTWATFQCPAGCTKRLPHSLHVFRSLTHGHLLATNIKTKIGHPNGDGRWEDAHANASFRHEHHWWQPTKFTLNQGDILETTCSFDTSSETQVTAIGPDTSNEMCMNIFMYYPKQSMYLCGYYSDEKSWCGTQEDFYP